MGRTVWYWNSRYMAWIMWGVWIREKWFIGVARNTGG